MYASSQEALEDDRLISVERATAELKRHYCRVVDTYSRNGVVERIQVTNEIDASEWIECTPFGILSWLGY